ncbi:MAG: hypothetical protein A2474_07000 [Elusimicrobia bacterium RIFOXYC2_FULL_34_12]|nr:MAG: hypothetical protein A2474_07000 [Elusimicrobia bacterium RIFOXYC2_FULL_34_12]OGS39382.1 MAG: hypothetical protein A2551_05700 [Elusimicrobia bacterium RIFOXYD2_FULL_34_30]HAM39121.1 hypothetical protein [Elusimicrobiota bacterium]
MNKNKITLLLIISFAISGMLYLGCGKKSKAQNQQEVTTPRPKPTIPEYVPPLPPKKYVYKGTAYRDPLLPGGGGMAYSALTTSGDGAETFTSEKLATLQLKGIFKDKSTNAAIIGDTSGGSYILKNGKIYNRRNKIVIGVSGVISKKSVTLICDDIKIELTMKKTGEEKEK